MFFYCFRKRFKLSRRCLLPPGFSMIPSTIMTNSYHAMLPSAEILAGVPNVPLSSILEYMTMPPDSQCNSLIRFLDLLINMNTSPLVGFFPILLVTMPASEWKLLRISVASDQSQYCKPSFRQNITTVVGQAHATWQASFLHINEVQFRLVSATQDSLFRIEDPLACRDLSLFYLQAGLDCSA